MTYEQYKIKPLIGTIKKLCDCHKDTNNKCLKKIDLNLPCGGKHFAIENYFSELVHDWEKDAARYNLGIQELDGIKYFTETTEDGEQLNKVTLTYRKGHEFILRTFNVAPKGEKGDDGKPGANGLSAFEIAKALGKIPRGMTESEWIDSLKGEKGDTSDTPILSEVDVEWVEDKRDEHGEWVLTSCDTYTLKLYLHKPDAFTELLNVITQINNNLIANYVLKSELPDFTTFEKKSENAHRLDFTGSTLSLIKNGSLEDSVQINIPQQNNYILPQTTDSRLGGIKTGYTGQHESTAKHYPVYVDGDGHAYTRVPNSDFTSDTFNINDYRSRIESWLQQALNTLENTLNNAIDNVRGQVSELQYLLSVIDLNGNVTTTINLTTDLIVAALRNIENGVISGWVLDTMAALNSLVLKQGENGTYIIQKLEENGTSNVAISADNIILDGNTIADAINALQVTVSGDLKATSLTLTESESDRKSFYAGEDLIRLDLESDHRIIYVFTLDKETEIIASNSNLVYTVNGEECTTNSVKLEKNNVYLIVNTTSGLWLVTNLVPINKVITQSELTVTGCVSSELDMSTLNITRGTSSEHNYELFDFECYVTLNGQFGNAPKGSWRDASPLLSSWTLNYKTKTDSEEVENASLYEGTAAILSFDPGTPFNNRTKVTGYIKINVNLLDELDDWSNYKMSIDGGQHWGALTSDLAIILGMLIPSLRNSRLRLERYYEYTETVVKTPPVTNANYNGFIVVNGLIVGLANENIENAEFNSDRTVVVGTQEGTGDLIAQNLTREDLTFEFNSLFYNIKAETTTTHLTGHATIDEAISLMTQDLLALTESLEGGPNAGDNQPANP